MALKFYIFTVWHFLGKKTFTELWYTVVDIYLGLDLDIDMKNQVRQLP